MSSRDTRLGDEASSDEPATTSSTETIASGYSFTPTSTWVTHPTCNSDSLRISIANDHQKHKDKLIRARVKKAERTKLETQEAARVAETKAREAEEMATWELFIAKTKLDREEEEAKSKKELAEGDDTFFRAIGRGTRAENVQAGKD